MEECNREVLSGEGCEEEEEDRARPRIASTIQIQYGYAMDTSGYDTDTA